MYIAYGLIKNEKSYGDIPWANTIADTFGTDEGISFAFINISKFSNESKNWQSDYDLISKFLMVVHQTKICLLKKLISLIPISL